jgi:LacI family transcriptional regulator
MVSAKRVTIKQVARASGVSTQTISRVLNDRPDVAPETRRRVQQVIAELGYAPNAIARSLIQGRSHTLGVVAHGLELYGPSHTLAGIEREATSLGYSMLLILLQQPDSQQEEAAFRNLLARQVDGILWAVPEIGGNRTWLYGGEQQFPVPVVFTNMQPRPGTVVVAMDNCRGGRLAVEHLLERNYRSVGIITGESSWWEARQRVLGWQEALSGRGLVGLERFMASGDWSAASGEECLRQLLKVAPEIDAVFACNDQMALGALKAARRLGRRVPQDLGIVGFDGTPESAFFVPGLTTIRQNLVELGARAVKVLNELVEKHIKGEEEPKAEIIWIKPELVVRESSSP